MDMTSLLFFFFSSRRRHTRSLRDWSSDVCSSDLPDSRRPVSTRLVIGPNASLSPGQALAFFVSMCLICLGIAAGFALLGRSEERRVGKECRSGWARYH